MKITANKVLTYNPLYRKTSEKIYYQATQGGILRIADSRQDAIEKVLACYQRLQLLKEVLKK